jgi:hypothetical protein
LIESVVFCVGVAAVFIGCIFVVCGWRGISGLRNAAKEVAGRDGIVATVLDDMGGSPDDFLQSPDGFTIQDFPGLLNTMEGVVEDLIDGVVGLTQVIGDALDLVDAGNANSLQAVVSQFGTAMGTSGVTGDIDLWLADYNTGSGLDACCKTACAQDVPPNSGSMSSEVGRLQQALSLCWQFDLAEEWPPGDSNRPIRRRARGLQHPA